MRRSGSGFLLRYIIGGAVAAGVLLSAVPVAAAAGEPVASPPPLWNAAKQGKFITALCKDNRGRIWVGTEDDGLWCDDPAASPDKRWTHFTVTSTGGTPSPGSLGPVLTNNTPNEHALGDNDIYAIACDPLGRIWVGHLNHGVSVYNGKSWRNYDVINGPLGERIFDIAVCPVTSGGGASRGGGDVWIATDAGLTRYSIKHDTWSYYTRGTTSDGNPSGGLPSDQIQAIAFGKDGTLYAATQCDGLAICKPVRMVGRASRPSSSDSAATLVYKHWRVVTSRYEDRPPIAPAGAGLPTNLLNDVLVAKDGTVWLATDEGLAWSRDRGHTWRYIRGKDWRDKAEGLYHPPSRARIDAAARGVNPNLLLSEDYVTCLAEDFRGGRGLIWMGHRDRGVEVLDPDTGARFRSNGKPFEEVPKVPRASGGASVAPVNPAKLKPKRKRKRIAQEDYVSALLLQPGRRPLVGFYGHGLVQLPDRFTPPPVLQHRRRRQRPRAAMAHPTSQPRASTNPPLPSPAAPPTTKQLEAMLAKVEKLREPLPEAWAAYLGDDWMTQGDWVGRYGREYAVLCAAGSPRDHKIYAPIIPVRVTCRMGPHHREEDSLRHWVEWVRTDKHGALYDPLIAVRRGASWDDHGEAYSIAYEGPSLWISVSIPAGTHRVAFYFLNKDGHKTGPRWRDFVLRVYGMSPDGTIDSTLLAKSRIRAFWGGVFKQFALQGPGTYAIKLDDNWSFDTIISGVFVDRLAGTPARAEGLPLVFMGDVRYHVPATPDEFPRSPILPPHGINVLFNEAWDHFPQTSRPDVLSWSRQVRLLTLRILWDEDKDPRLTGTARWCLHLWTAKDRAEFIEKMRRAWHNVQLYDPDLRTKKFRQYSPNVYDTPDEWAEAQLPHDKPTHNPQEISR